MHFISFIPWYNDPAWWTAIGTIFLGLAALFVAFFQVKINKRLKSTKLDSKIKLESPDCHYIEITTASGFNSPCYYIRARITNTGLNVAENIQVMIDKIWHIDEQNNKENVKSFLPMNLVWSHYGGVTMNMILPKHFRHCDIGYFYFLGNKVNFKIDTIVQPNKVEGGVYPNILPAGKYQIDLIFGADNVLTFKESYEVSFNNNFYNNEKEMFSKNIVIKKI